MSSRRLHAQSGGDQGAVAVIVAISLILLFLVTALAIDLGFARADVRHNQSVSDFAGIAAARSLNEGYVKACEAAVDYVFANSETLASGSDDHNDARDECSAFQGLDNSGCDAATAPVTVTIVAGAVTITVTSPVEDDDPAMILEGQTIVPEVDGTPCDRVKVGVVRDRNYIFAPAAGLFEGSAFADAVSVWFEEEIAGDIASLIVLEPEACDVLTTDGSNAAFRVSNHPDGSPGLIAVDSDGSASGTGGIEFGSWCRDRRGDPNNNTYVIHQKQGSICALGGIGSYALGVGNATLAHPGSGTDPCIAGSSGQLGTSVEPRTRRMGRRSVDWLFNCRPSYVGLGPHLPQYEEVTPPCPEPDDGERIAYIDILREKLQSGSLTSLGFESISGADCVSPLTRLGTGSERYHVECGSLPNVMEFRDVAAVVFNGGLHQKRLVVEGPMGAGTVVYFRDEGLSTPNGGSDACNSAASGNAYCLRRVFAYVESPNDGRAIHFNNGNHVWEGLEKSEAEGQCTDNVSNSNWVPEAACFAPLALWANTSDDQQLAGGISGSVSGSFFIPNAHIKLAGGGGLDFTSAQFFARTMVASGNGAVLLEPDKERGIPEIRFNQGLIR